MRPLKMLGLAAIAAVAAMAFVGVGTASAVEKTVLCKNATHPCTEVYPAETSIAATSTNTQLKVNVLFVGEVKVNCAESTVGGKTKEAQGQEGQTENHLGGQIETLTFTGCKVLLGVEEEQCVVSAVQLPYQTLLEQKATNDQDGKMSVYEKDLGQPGALVVCDPIGIFNTEVNCTYKADEENEQVKKANKEQIPVVNFDVIGGQQAEIKAEQGGEQVQLKEAPEPGHESCPGSNPKWGGTYIVDDPKPLFVSHVIK